MDIEEVYRERTSRDAQTEECLDCGDCIKRCPYELNTAGLIKEHSDRYWSILQKNGITIVA